MEEDGPSNNEHSYLDEENRIVFRRREEQQKFHSRHQRTIHPRRTVVVTDVGTETSQEQLIPEVSIPEFQPSTNSCPITDHRTLDEGSILDNLEVLEPPIAALPVNEGSPEDAISIQNSNSRPVRAKDSLTLPRKISEKNKRRRPKAQLKIINNNQQDRKPDYPGRLRSYTESAFQRPDPPRKFYQPAYVHQMMERAQIIGVNLVPKWQQDGIDIIQDFTTQLERIHKCLRTADLILHTTAQGSNMFKDHHKLIFAYFYVGLIINCILPEYDQSARFLDHMHVHLFNIETITTRNLKLGQKLEKGGKEIVSKILKEMQRQIYLGIVCAKLPPSTSTEGQVEGQSDAHPLETSVRKAGVDEQTLLISSFTNTIVFECKETPELGSRGVKDLVPQQLLCLIQVLLEDITCTVKLVNEELETGYKFLSSNKTLKNGAGSVKSTMNTMRKDMFLRSNNCSGALAKELQRLAADISNFQVTLQSVTKISKWTLVASECMFAEARAWAPGLKMLSPYQNIRKGLQILNCFGQNIYSPDGVTKAFPELFAEVGGSEIFDAAQMQIPVHRARKAFLFDEYIDETSEVILFGEESFASLESRTLSILQLRPVTNETAEVTVESDATESTNIEEPPT